MALNVTSLVTRHYLYLLVALNLGIWAKVDDSWNFFLVESFDQHRRAQPIIMGQSRKSTGA